MEPFNYFNPKIPKVRDLENNWETTQWLCHYSAEIDLIYFTGNKENVRNMHRDIHKMINTKHKVKSKHGKNIKTNEIRCPSLSSL